MRCARSLGLLFTCCSLLTLAPSVVQAQSPGPGAIAPEAPESSEVQDESARALHAQIVELFQSRQYGQIDALAQQLRSQRVRFRGGAWQLTVLYGAIRSPGSMTATDADWQALIAKLQGWIASDQGAPTPRIALAQAYLTFAWKARGNGFANTVTPQGWALFSERVQSARTALEDARGVSVNCPEWYRAMQTVALAQGWPGKQVDLLAQAAMAHDPEYYYFALAEANYLLPKWYGKPGDTEAYAAQVADAVGGREGDALYFLVASRLNCCKRAQAAGMDEARVQRGFAALDQMYGSTNRERNEAAFLALRAGDTTAAQALFARIGNDWAAAVWRSKARFDASRTGQPVGGVLPVGPVPAGVDQGNAANAGS
jgi:hypothetical protein